MLKALSDPIRLRLLSLIASHGGGEACVCDISQGIDVGQPTISHHLRVLREAGWVTSERQGTWVWYALRPEAAARLRWLGDLLSPGEPTPVPPAGSGSRKLAVIQPPA